MCHANLVKKKTFGLALQRMGGPLTNLNKLQDHHKIVGLHELIGGRTVQSSLADLRF